MSEEAIEDVKSYLRSGGVMLWNQWQEMDAATKAVFMEAGEQLDAERMAMLALAIQSDEGAAQVFSRVDQGDALVRRGMLNAVGRAVERMRT